MKPLPDISNAEAMFKRGQRSALAESIRHHVEGLRDAYNVLQSAEWDALDEPLALCKEHCDRLLKLSAMWREIA